LYLHSNAENYIAHENTYFQSLETDYADEATSAFASIRSSLSAAKSAFKSAASAHLKDYGKLINVSETDDKGLLKRIYQYMIDNSLDVNSRGISYGAVSAGGSNVGDGTVQRLTVDENNEPLEHCHVELKTLTCINFTEISLEKFG